MRSLFNTDSKIRTNKKVYSFKDKTLTLEITIDNEYAFVDGII